MKDAVENDLRAEIVTFWRKFGKLLGGGVPVMPALGALQRQFREKSIRVAIDEISDSLRGGRTISEAIGQMPQMFPAPVVALVKAAEESGELDEMAGRIADEYERGDFELGELKSVRKGARRKTPASDGIIEKLNDIVQRVVKLRATELHFEPYWHEKEQKAHYRVRMRIDGVLSGSEELSEAEFKALLARIKLMSDLDVAEKKKPQAGRILLKVEGQKLDLRVGTMPTVLGERLSTRIVEAERLLVGLDKSDLSRENLRTIDNWLEKGRGLILVVGPVGCGKTTILYSMLSRLSKSGKIVAISVEDPVEVILPGVNQVQIEQDIGLTFSRLLHAVLWQEPDVVSVCDVRDKETAILLPEIALGGHLVLAGAYRRGAPEGVSALVELGVDAHLLGQSLTGCVSQVLVRKLCPKCRRKYAPSVSLLKSIGLPASFKGVFYRAGTCKDCFTGYKGRIAIHEVLEASEGLRELLIQCPPKEAVRKFALSNGMKSFMDDGIAKAAMGLTTIEEVLRVSCRVA